MDTKPIDNLVAEKLEMIPEVIQVTLHRHDEQFTEAKEAFETGYIYEALDALSEAAQAFADLAAYISYVEGYAESRYDLLQEAADPSPPGFVVAEGFQKGVWVLPQFLPQFCQRESPEGHPPGAFFVLSV